MNYEGGMFFICFEFECEDLLVKEVKLEESFKKIVNIFLMNWQFIYVYNLKKIVIFVLKEFYCLLELLWVWESGDLMIDIVVVVSNYEDVCEVVELFGILFKYIFVIKDIC